jgi:hypothetical protein
MIQVAGIKLKEKTLLNRYGDEAIFIDVTSKANPRFLPLSPFFPHGNIPVPFSGEIKWASVEGIWQGLKVFNEHDVDMDTIKKGTMQNIKRTIRAFGYPKGHRKGIDGTELLDYIEARILIYLPIYKWVLDNKCQEIINEIKQLSKNQNVVLLDFATNDNLFIANKPLSHAALIKLYVEGNYPDSEELIKLFRSNPEITSIEQQKIKLEQKKEKLRSKGIDPDQTTLNF